ncbi:MAG: hypothetical protein KAS71_06910 [Bacteroidales bacterium]|nr:hypothetical protein [Bacteroidales bacterium]
MLRIAIQGNLSEGTKFVELIRNTSDCILSGLCTELNSRLTDSDKLIDHPVPVFDNLEELFHVSDAIIFLNHRKSGISNVKQALKRSKHVFIQPESLLGIELLNEYQNLAEEAGVLFYIFHNPIKADLEDLIRNSENYPEFIDISRNVYEIDEKIPDVRKLILREILFLTSINQQAIKRFKTLSVPYNSLKPYLINLKIDFANSSSANVTINNFSGADSRNTEIYFRDKMLHMNTLEKNIKVSNRNNKEVDCYPLHTLMNDESDPSSDIEHFIHKLKTFAYPANSFESGIYAYVNSWEILEKIVPAIMEK